MSKKLFKKMFVILFLLAFISFTVIGTAYYFNLTSGKIPFNGTIFEISTGETLSNIISRLEDEELIRSGIFLRVFSLIMNTEQDFKSGTYKIEYGYTTREIHDLLISGKQKLITITIPEGWTIRRIADLLDENNIIDKNEFIAAATSAEIVNSFDIPGSSVEGFLFPDTYLFPENYPADQIISVMINNLYNNLQEIAPDYTDWKRKDLYDFIILASIVEREYKVPEEAPIIGSVFQNRLSINMGLESCATIEYIITEILGKPHPERITEYDTKLDSLYNTYEWAGLPPGPICNPGKIALDGVFNPEDTDFFYFVLKDVETGEHYFSRELQEHNQARFYLLK
jgi:UPF0755 protein